MARHLLWALLAAAALLSVSGENPGGRDAAAAAHNPKRGGADHPGAGHPAAHPAGGDGDGSSEGGGGRRGIDPIAVLQHILAPLLKPILGEQVTSVAFYWRLYMITSVVMFVSFVCCICCCCLPPTKAAIVSCYKGIGAGLNMCCSRFLYPCVMSAPKFDERAAYSQALEVKIKREDDEREALAALGDGPAARPRPKAKANPKADQPRPSVQAMLPRTPQKEMM
jgi:hypothetical protein